MEFLLGILPSLESCVPNGAVSEPEAQLDVYVIYL